MDKEKIGYCLQLMALVLFVVMALACASQEAVVDDAKGRGAGLNDGATIDVPTDSVHVSYDYALK